MDAKELFPEGWHPMMPALSPDGEREANSVARSKVSLPKYYITDFERSIFFNNIERREVAIPDGDDPTVPETRNSLAEYDPFPVDIYTFGNLLKDDVLQVRA
jgi:hypothetical protein